MSSPHSFKVDLRLRHPSMDFGEVAQLLGMTPKYVWQAGEARRRGPNRILLPGVNDRSYWLSSFGPRSWRVAGGDEALEPAMDEVVDELLDHLAPHADFLRRVAEQGQVEIWVSSQSQGSYPLVLHPESIMRMAVLGITLVHDVYGAHGVLPPFSAGGDG